MKITDKTFVHPHYLIREILCGYNKLGSTYVGREGSSLSTGPFSFASVGAGYLLSSKALAEYLHVLYVFFLEMLTF